MTDKAKKTRLIKNYLYNLSYQIFVIIVPLLTTPYISRVLGAEKIGIYSYTLSISTYFIVMGNLGFPLYGQREIAFTANNRKQYSKVFSEIIIGKVITLIIALVLYIAYVELKVTNYKAIYLCHIIGIVADIINIGWLYQGLENFRIIAIRNFVIKIISVIALFIFVKNSADLINYTLIINLSNLIGNSLLFLNIRKVVDFNDLHISLNKVLKHVKPALFLGIPYYITSIYVVVDKTMLGMLCKKYSEVGYYEQSQKIITFSVAIITALGTVYMPRLANEMAEKNTDNVHSFLNSGLKIIILISVPLTIGLLCVANMIVPWFFGKGYEKVGGLLMIFAPLAFIMGVTNFIGNQYLVVSKNERKLTITIILGVIINCGLNLLLIPKLASYGAAIATVISELIKLCVQLYIVRNIISMRKFYRNFIQYTVYSLVMGSAIVIFKLLVFNKYTFVNTMILTLIGGLLYFFMLFVLDKNLRN